MTSSTDLRGNVDPFPMLDELPVIDLSPDVDGTRHVARAAGYDEGRRAGFEQGRFEGQARGRAEGRAEASERVEHVLAALDAAVDDLHRRDATALAAMSEEIIDLVIGLATTILAREVEADTEPGRAAIVRALELVPERGELRARLHPDDLDSIGDIADLRGLAGDRPIELVADSSVERGGCVLEAGPCRIDAQVGAALARARAALEGFDET